MLRFCPDCGSRLDATPPCSCPVCGTRHWANPRPCAGAFVEHEGHVLLVQRGHQPWAGHWDVPGGFCDGDEHPEATAVREAREETGLDIEVTGLVGMWIDRYGDDTAPATLNIYYRATAAHPDVAADGDEVAALRWFSPADVPGLPLAFPAHMELAVRAWLDGPPSG